MKGAFIGFLVMLALGAGGSSAARMTVLREGAVAPASRPAAASHATAAPETDARPPLSDLEFDPDSQP
jgi:hypothetical protein